MDARVEGLTVATLARALDLAVLRHQVIASNIANAALPGHAARRVDFAGEVVIQRDAAGLPAGVQVEAQLTALAHNQLHYQVLVKALTRHLSILSSAVNDGKR